MKYFGLSFATLFFTNVLLAQDVSKYHIFITGDKSGVVDINNSTVLNAAYLPYPEKVKSKNLWILKSDNKTVTFNYEDGTSKTYQEYRAYSLWYRDTSYIKVKENGKSYFLSALSDKKIDIKYPEKRYDAVGDYFYTNETITNYAESVKDKKTGRYLPPKQLEKTRQYSFYKSPSDTKSTFDITADGLIILKKESVYSYHVEYLVFPKGSTAKVFNNQLKLVKTINNYKGDEYALQKELSKLFDQPLYIDGAAVAGIAERKYPYLDTKETNEATVVYVVSNNTNEKRNLFSYTGKVKTNGTTVTLMKNGKRFASFDVDVKNGKVFYPKELLNSLGLDYSIKQEADQQIYKSVDEEASFPGGMSNYAKFLGDNFQVPDAASENGISGMIRVKIIIEKDGSITNIAIEKGLCKECDAEAIRVIKRMPKWTPAKVDNEPVRSAKIVNLNIRTE